MTNDKTPEFWLARYTTAGFSFFNTGSALKKVVTKWTEFQSRKPDDVEIFSWLRFRTQNYAIVCGEISNLIVMDVDTKNGGDPTPFLNRGFYEVSTPSGGYHFYFRYDPILRSTKHLRSGIRGNFLHGIDVQSNNALVFAPPSKFINQNPYLLVCDTPIEPMPDDLLAATVDSLQPEKSSTANITPFKPLPVPENGRPGDIFNALASWDDVLLPLGWTYVGTPRQDGTQFWRRPNKRRPNEGISASTNYKGYDLFFPYTKFYPELEWKRGYTKFRLYATLVHEGDFRAAARALVIGNYQLLHAKYDKN